MKYKAIALDLDGTLKSSDKKILTETKEILMRLAKEGVIIILASGRPTAGLFLEAKELGLDKTGGYLLSFNGARVVDYPKLNVIYQKTFTSDVATAIYDRAKEYNLAVMTYSDEAIITEDTEDCYVKEEATINHMPLKKVTSFKDSVGGPIHKVLLTAKPEYAAKVIDEFKQPYGDSLSIYRSAPFFIEVMAQNVDKAESLQRLLDALAITKEELIAFGDGYNDLSMIAFAGFGVAMDNAVEEVKQRADYITASNDENGIAKCLQMLKEKGEI